MSSQASEKFERESKRKEKKLWKTMLPLYVHMLFANCRKVLHHLLFQLPNLQCKCINHLEEDKMRGSD